MKSLFSLVLSVLIFSVLTSCKRDNKGDYSPLDNELEAALKKASGGKGISYYRFPASDNYAMIPQDPNNPLTKAKVELGKLLFHETMLGGVPKETISIYTYSCASSHHSAAGFQAGIRQGIGEGGSGFGIKGETRDVNPLCQIPMIDFQPIRTPSAMNAMYQTNMLWNGQFGANGVNKNTEYA